MKKLFLVLIIFVGILSISMSEREPLIVSTEVQTAHCSDPNSDDYITKSYVNGSAVFTYHTTYRSAKLMHVSFETEYVIDASEANFTCITWINQ